jgi:hypothetical protein
MHYTGAVSPYTVGCWQVASIIKNIALDVISERLGILATLGITVASVKITDRQKNYHHNKANNS